VVVLAVAAEYGLGHPTPADLTEEQQIGILKVSFHIATSLRFKYFFYHGYELYLTLWFVKVSIIAFYARISWGTSYRSYRILAYITMVILFCSFVVIMFYKTFVCFPLVYSYEIYLQRHEFGIQRINVPAEQPRNTLVGHTF
jgi:hypothetical protein